MKKLRQHKKKYSIGKISHRQIKIFRLAVKLSTVLVISIIILQILFRYYSHFLIGKVISEIVSIQSNGLYRVEYEDISVNFIKRKMSIRELYILGDLKKYKNLLKRDSTRNIYNVYIPEGHITDFGLLKIFFLKKIHFGTFDVEKPHVKILTSSSKHSNGNIISQWQQLKIDNLYSIIEGKFKNVYIGKCNINDASLIIDHLDNMQDYTEVITDISISLNDFQLDKDSQYKHRFLHSSKATIRLFNQHIESEKNKHTIDIEDINISTTDSVFSIYGVNVFPTIKSPLSDRYELFIPSITFSRINFKKSLQSGKIFIGKVFLEKPTFKFTKSSVKKAAELDSIFNFRALLPDYLEIFHIDTIEIEESDITVKNLPKWKSQHFPNLSARFFNFSVDSSIVPSKKYFYVDNFWFHFENQSIKVPNSDYYLSADEVMLSSQDSVLRLKDAHFSLLKKNPFYKKEIYDINVPYLSFSGLDMHKIYSERKFVCNELVVKKPTGQHYSYSQIHRKNLQKRNLETEIKNLFKSISIKKICLDRGAFSSFGKRNSKKRLDGKNLFLTVRNFKMEDSTIVLPEDLSVSLSHLEIYIKNNSHLLTLKELDFSLKDSLLTVKSGKIEPLNLQADTLSNTYHLSFNNFLATGIDWKSNYDTLKIKNIRFAQLQFNHEIHSKINNLSISDKQSIFYLSPKYISISRVNIDKGNWKNIDNRKKQNIYYIQNFKLSVDNFQSSINQPYFSFFSDLQLKGEHCGIYFMDSMYFLNAHALDISSMDNSARVIQVSFSNLKKKSNQYHISIPQIRLEGFDIKNLYEDHIFSTSSLTIMEPEVNLNLHIKNSKRSKKIPFSDSLYSYIKNQLNSIYIDTFNVVNGSAKLLATDKNKRSYDFKSEKFSVQIQDFQLDSIAHLNDDHLFFTRNIELDIYKYQHDLHDSRYKFGFEKMNLSTARKSLQIEKLHFKTSKHFYQDDSSKNLLDIFFPHVSFSEINFHHLYKYQKLDIENIYIPFPKFRIFNNISLYQQEFSNSFLPDLHRQLKPFLKEIHFNKVIFDSGFVSFNDSYNKSVTNFVLPNVFCQFNNFKFDSTSLTDKNKIFGMEEINIHIRDYHSILKEGIWKIRADEIELNTSKSNFDITNLVIEPTIDKYNFTKVIGYQTDWLYFYIKNVFFRNINYHDLLFKNTLKADMIDILEMRIEAYRDKKESPLQEVKPTVREFIREFPMHLKIDTIALLNGYIQYEELIKNGKRPGFIYLSDLNTQIHQLTNDSFDKKALKINLQGYLMGSGELKAHFHFPSNNNDYLYRGSLAAMNMKELNSILENVVYVSVKHGRSNKLDFEVVANNDYAVGNMHFYYKNLKIVLLDGYKQRHSGGHKRKGILSFLTNTFVVRSGNPKFIFLNKGNIYYQRNAQKSPFNYWIKTLINGIRTSMGVKKNTKPPKHIRKNVKAIRKKH